MPRRILLVPIGLCAFLACGGGGETDEPAAATTERPPSGSDDVAPASPPASGRDAASSTDAGAGDAAGPCPQDMVAVASFCVDRYEAPNKKGERPLAFKTAPEGEAWCAARGKRLCTEAEWVRACNGTNARPFPYGATYAKSACNDDKTWISPDWTTLGTYPAKAATDEATRLYQADPSGSRAACASEDGVMDLTGNVAEWVVRSFEHANDYAHVMKGCYWAGCYGGAPPSCSFVNPAHPGTFRTYEAGFRCCSAQASSGG